MLVHTKGEITERYLTERRRAGGNVEALSVGQTLAPSVRYVQESLQRLIALEVLLVFKVGSRIEKQLKDAAAEWLVGKLDFLVSREMWQSVCLIVDSFDGIGHKRDVELSVKINGWLGHKNHDDTDGVSSCGCWRTSRHTEPRREGTRQLVMMTPELLRGRRGRM
jgi:hypothetical protein